MTDAAPRPSHRLRHPAPRMVVAALLALVLAAGLVPGTGRVLAPEPAGADTTLRLLRNVDVPLDTLTVPTGTSEYKSSPALADLDGDDRPELVVAAPNGTVTATRITDGATLWRRSLGRTAIQASPVVTDVDNDGRVDVVAATMDGRVVLLSGQTGGVKRTFRQGAPLFCPSGTDCRPDGFYATPVIADVNGDGRNDIIAPSYDHTVYAWSWGGTLLWRSYLYDTLWSSPAAVDVDKNGTLEIVLGGDIYAGNPLGLPAGGLLWVLNGRNGTRFSGYPRSLPGQTIWSSPAIADIDGDTRMDVVVGTGSNGPFGDGSAARRVWAFTLATRKDLPGWPASVPGRVVNQPAVGDIDNDGRPEVVVGTEGAYVVALEHDGARKWATCNYSSTAQCPGSPNLATHGGVAIADVDDDGIQEVVSALSPRLRVYRGFDRQLEADELLTSYSTIGPTSVAAIGEINGSTVIAQSAFFRSGGHSGPARAGDVVRTSLYTTDQPLCTEDWPGFKRGPARASVLAPRPPWNPFPCARPFVAQQYRDLLGRELDADGATFWAARLRTTWTGQRVVAGFLNSSEFGEVAAPISRLHLALKGGPPIDGTQVRDQMQQLRQGASLATIAQQLLGRGPWASETDDQLVTRVYFTMLRRSPTSAQRSTALADIQGRGRAAWLADLSRTSEAVAKTDARVQVVMIYVGLLARGPDQGGWDYWAPRAETGTPVQRLIELFLNSGEYKGRVL